MRAMTIGDGSGAGVARASAMEAALPAEAAFDRSSATLAHAAPETDHYTGFLSTAPSGRVSRRLALAIVIVSTVFFFAAAPFAKEAMTPLWAFIPIYQSALVINDLVTAVLLFGQFAILRSKGLLVLAGGYLFTACMAAVHGLTFPGLFAPGGLLGAGPQTTAWLYMFWHGVFPLCVIAYCLLQGRDGATQPARGSAARDILISIGAILLAVGAFAAVATRGHDYLPA